MLTRWRTQLRSAASTPMGLLRLLRDSVGWRGLTQLVAVFAAAPAIRVLRPIATGVLITSLAAVFVGDRDVSLLSAGLPAALLFLFVVMVLEDVTTGLGVVTTQRVQLKVTSRVRERLRLAARMPQTIRHLEDPRWQDQLMLVQKGVRGMLLGRMTVSLTTTTMQLVQVLVFAVMVAFFSVPLAALLLVLTLFTRGQSLRVAAASSELAAEQAALLRRSDYLRDATDSARTAKDVRVFGIGQWMQERFRREYLAYFEPIWAFRSRTTRRLSVLYTVFAVVFGGSCALIVAAALRGQLSVGEMTTYVMAVVGVRAGLNTAGSTHHYAEAPLRALREVEDAARRDALIEPVPAPAPATAGARPPGEIRFEHVSFRYPGGDRDVLRDFNLTLPAGRSVAIVGLNGAGKSTIVKLLAGLHRPTAGRITADGVDLADIGAEEWRRRLAVMFQQYSRFEMSLRDNVGFGSLELADDVGARERAADDAGLQSMIDELPNGWETVLSPHYQGGVDLSGGQWQRVALARTLLAAQAGASVAVLDEPTASLDVRAEAEFFGQALTLTQGMTTVLISHRFSTVRRADHIVVIESGQVVESGDHDSLLADGGVYAGLFHTQADRFADVERTDA